MFSFSSLRACRVLTGAGATARSCRHSSASLCIWATTQTGHKTIAAASSFSSTAQLNNNSKHNSKRTYPRIPLDGPGLQQQQEEHKSDSVHRLYPQEEESESTGAVDRSLSLRDRYSSNRRRDDARDNRGGHRGWDRDRYGDNRHGGDPGGGDRGAAFSRREQRRRDYDDKYSGAGDRSGDRGPAFSRREQRRRDYDDKYSGAGDRSGDRGPAFSRREQRRRDYDDKYSGAGDRSGDRGPAFSRREQRRRDYDDKYSGAGDRGGGRGEGKGGDRGGRGRYGDSDGDRGGDRNRGGRGRYQDQSSAASASNYNSQGREGPGPDREEWGYFEGDHLFGISPIKAALSAAPARRQFTELFVQEGMDTSTKKDSSGAAYVMKRAEKLNLAVREVSKHALNMLSENRPNQGFVLRASERRFLPLPTAISGGPVVSPLHGVGRNVILALDEVWDPMNMGALLRTALFLGATGVVVCSKNCAPLSATVSKASSGALESMDIYEVGSMVKYLEESRDEGCAVLGTSLSQKALDIQTLSLSQLTTAGSSSDDNSSCNSISSVSQPIILVLGNEGHGLRTNILNKCTHLVKIPRMTVAMGASAGGEEEGEESHHVDSLNVSVAGGILLHSLLNLQDK